MEVGSYAAMSQNPVSSGSDHFRLGQRVVKWHHFKIRNRPNMRADHDPNGQQKSLPQRSEVSASFRGKLPKDIQANSNT